MKKLFLALLCSGCTLFAQAQLLSSGLVEGNTFANITGIGSFNWTNTANAKTENGGQASASVALSAFSTATTRYVSALNFATSIPDDAEIDGIKVRIKRRAQGLGLGCSIKDEQVKLIKGGVVTGRNYAATNNWTGTFTYIEYGDDTTKWGNTWTAADINSADFGVGVAVKINSGALGISLTAEIDHIQTIVYYHMPPVALPVELLWFNASLLDTKQVQFTWATALEFNNDYFSIERSVDGADWERITEVDGMGNSTVVNRYSYTDQLPVSGTNYYRLKQVDYDGAYEYSSVVSMHIQADHDISINYSSINDKLSISGNAMQPVMVAVYDLSGRLTESFTTNVGESTTLGLREHSGMYIVTASAGGSIVTRRLYR